MNKVFLLVFLVLVQVAFSAIAFATTSQSGSIRPQKYHCTYNCPNEGRCFADIRTSEFWNRNAAKKLGSSNCLTGCPCKKVAGILSLDWSSMEQSFINKCNQPRKGDPTKPGKSDPKNPNPTTFSKPTLPKKISRGSKRGFHVLENEDEELEFFD
jgi:hypothetical protein